MNCPTENTRVEIFGAALNFDGEVSYTPRNTEAVGTRKSWYIYLLRKKSKSTWARMWDMVWSFQASSCLRCKRSRLVSWSPSPFVTSAVHLDQDFQIPPYLKQWKYVFIRMKSEFFHFYQGCMINHYEELKQFGFQICLRFLVLLRVLPAIILHEFLHSYTYYWPSKQNLMLTGISMPRAWYAWSAWIHPKTGPLSSVDPRP